MEISRYWSQRIKVHPTSENGIEQFFHVILLLKTCHMQQWILGTACGEQSLVSEVRYTVTLVMQALSQF